MNDFLERRLRIIGESTCSPPPDSLVNVHNNAVWEASFRALAEMVAELGKSNEQREMEDAAQWAAYEERLRNARLIP